MVELFLVILEATKRKKENMGSASRVESSNYDYYFKVLLIGDSGFGKSSLLLSFISNSNSINDLSPTIGTFFLSCLGKWN